MPPIYFGAGKPERAVQTLRFAILIAAGFGLVVSIVMQFAAEPVVSLFTDRNAAGGTDVIRFGGQYLRGYISFPDGTGYGCRLVRIRADLRRRICRDPAQGI